MKQIQVDTASQLLSGAALTHDVVIGTDTRDTDREIELLGVYLAASSAISQVVTVTHIGSEGANYTFVIATSTLSSATSYVYLPSGATPKFRTGDTIRFTCANSGTPAITVYSKIHFKEIE